MKPKITVSFRRNHAGDVIGEMTAEGGEVINSRNFGPMSGEEIKRVLEVFQAENPESVVLPIELSGN